MTRTLVIAGLLLLAVLLPQMAMPVTVAVLVVPLLATFVTMAPVPEEQRRPLRFARTPRAPPSR